MDLDDLLEDLLEDAQDRARDTVRQVRDQYRERSRVPAFRARLRTATLWASGAWFTSFGGLAAASELAIDGGAGTALAVLLAGIALPAVPTGVWAWRARRRDRVQARDQAARRRARQERDQLPVDTIDDWTRLRQAQTLVEDLAAQGLVDTAAVAELGVMVEQLHGLLIADQRATKLGAEPSGPLRQQLGDTADLLVALAAEAVEHRTEQVGESTVPATLRDARDRLRSLREARAEVDAADRRADAAQELVQRDWRTVAGPGTTPDSTPGPTSAGRGASPDTRRSAGSDTGRSAGSDTGRSAGSDTGRSASPDTGHPGRSDEDEPPRAQPMPG